MKLICSRCGVRSRDFPQDLNTWRCSLCMTKQPVHSLPPKEKKTFIKEIEFKPDFELGDEDAKKEKE